MTRTFSRSFQLVKESFRILKKDKELIWFPIISGFLNLLLVGFVMGMLCYHFITNPIETEKNMNTYIPYFVILGLFMWILTCFITGFFNAGLITCAFIRLNGGDPTFKDGFKNALKYIKKIFLWAVAAGTVGYILERISKQKEILFQIIGIAGRLAWSLLIFFVIPVIIFEKLGIKESIRRSGELFKKTWGENVIGQFSMASVFVLLFLIIIPLTLIMGVSVQHESLKYGTSVTYEVPFIIKSLFSVIIVFYFIALFVIYSSLQGIFVTALYYYATTGKIPPDYSPEVIKYAFVPKSPFGRL